MTSVIISKGSLWWDGGGGAAFKKVSRMSKEFLKVCAFQHKVVLSLACVLSHVQLFVTW